MLLILVVLVGGSSVRWEWVLTGDVCAEEMLQSAGVVEVEVAHYDRFDVFDVVAGRFDGVGELHLLGVDCAWEEIGEWRTPFLLSCCSVHSV